MKSIKTCSTFTTQPSMEKERECRADSRACALGGLRDLELGQTRNCAVREGANPDIPQDC